MSKREQRDEQPERGHPNQRRNWAGLVIVASSFVALALVAFLAPGPRTGYTDFLSFYAGARLVGTPHLYSHEHAHRIQQNYGRPEEVRPYVRLPFYAQLLWPLGRLRYESGQLVWQALNLAALATFVWLWSQRAIAAAVACWYFPTWVSFAIGQDAPILLCFLAISLYCYKRGHRVLAGAVFALCSIKFHLFLLTPVIIIARKMWGFGAGLLTGGALLLILSFAAAGIDWPIRYLALLQANEAAENAYGKMANLVGLFLGHDLPYGTVLVIVFSAAIVLLSLKAFQTRSIQLALALVPAAGLILSPHAYLTDCVLLIPAFTALAENSDHRSDVYLLALPVVGALALLLTDPRISYLAQLMLIGTVVRLLITSASARSVDVWDGTDRVTLASVPGAADKSQ